MNWESRAFDELPAAYTKKDTRPIISHLAQAMLAKYGSLMSGGSGVVRWL